jgi:hypothetical protein
VYRIAVLFPLVPSTCRDAGCTAVNFVTEIKGLQTFYVPSECQAKLLLSDITDNGQYQSQAHSTAAETYSYSSSAATLPLQPYAKLITSNKHRSIYTRKGRKSCIEFSMCNTTINQLTRS